MTDAADTVVAPTATDEAAVPTAAKEEALALTGTDDNGRPWRRVFLEKPLDRHGTKYSSIVVRKPLGTDCVGTSLTALNDADVAALSVVLPRVTEPALSKQEIGRMEIDDLGEFAGAIMGFLLSRAVKAAVGLTE